MFVKDMLIIDVQCEVFLYNLYMYRHSNDPMYRHPNEILLKYLFYTPSPTPASLMECTQPSNLCMIVCTSNLAMKIVLHALAFNSLHTCFTHQIRPA